MGESKVTFHSAASATAAGNAMNLAGIAAVAVQLTGAWVATVTPKATIDGSNWVAVEAYNVNTGIWSTVLAANGLYLIPVAGLRLFELDMVWASGTSITATGIGVGAHAVPFGHSPGPYGQSLARKTLTFVDTTTAQTIFTVTGAVLLRLFAICGADLASAGGCNAVVGIAGTTNLFIASTDVLAIDAGKLWYSNTPVAAPSVLSTVAASEWVIPNGQDVILTPSAQIDSGAITFYGFWTPLSAGATVA